MAEEVDAVVFKRHNVRRGQLRAKRELDAGSADGSDHDVEDRISATKMEQRLKRRAKGLQAVQDESGDAREGATRDDELDIGTAFMEQTSTTELDRARERYVEEQLERLRRGEAPVAWSSLHPMAAVGGSDRFVRSKEEALENSTCVTASRVVPEVDIQAEEARLQYEATARVLEEARARDAARAAAGPPMADRVVHNFNAVAFDRTQPPTNDTVSRRRFIEHNKHRM